MYFGQIMPLFILRKSWLRFLVQDDISTTTTAIALKLHTSVQVMKQGEPIKSHNSDFYCDHIMPFFGLRKFWLNFLVQDGISTTTDIALKLQTSGYKTR